MQALLKEICARYLFVKAYKNKARTGIYYYSKWSNWTFYIKYEFLGTRTWKLNTYRYMLNNISLVYI